MIIIRFRVVESSEVSITFECRYGNHKEAIERYSDWYCYLQNAYLKGRIEKFEINMVATQEGVD